MPFVKKDSHQYREALSYLNDEVDSIKGVPFNPNPTDIADVLVSRASHAVKAVARADAAATIRILGAIEPVKDESST